MAAGSDPIRDIIEPTIESMGFDLVRVSLGGGATPTLQLMIEPSDGSPLSVENCAEVSRSVSAVLDVADPIAGAYQLEVSSPGIDRPLVRARDFTRFEGHEAKIELSGPIEGRKRFRGPVLGESDDGTVGVVDDEGRTVRFPVERVRAAKLILTDDLIAAARERAEAARKASGGVDASGGGSPTVEGMEVD